MPNCVIINSRYSDFTIERSVLEPLGVTVTTISQELDERELIHTAGDADAILVNLTKVTEHVMDALPRLKVISRYGVGLDNIDTAYAKKKGIAVLNVPDYCTAEVAEHTIALMLALIRGIPARSDGVKAGRWDMPEQQYTLREQTLGIIGYGTISRAVIIRCLAFLPKAIFIYSRHAQSVPAPSGKEERMLFNLAEQFAVPVHFVPLDVLLAESTIISLHASLSEENHHILDAWAFSCMKPGVLIINTARGGLIDFEALYEAVQRGIVGGAGLDVFESEPPLEILEKLSGDQFILSDHTAFRSVDSQRELKRRCAENAARALGLL